MSINVPGQPECPKCGSEDVELYWATYILYADGALREGEWPRGYEPAGEGECRACGHELAAEELAVWALGDLQ